MSLSMTVVRTVQAGGMNFPFSTSITGDNIAATEVSIAAAKGGSLSTRTDTINGTLTMAGGHGFVTSDVLDLFWSGGMRRGVTATVSTNTVTFGGGTGDILPTTNTTISAMKPDTETVNVVGANTKGIAVYGSAAGAFSLCSSGGVEVYGLAVGAAAGSTQSYCWTNADNTTNPVTGSTLLSVRLSHGDLTTAQTFRLAILHS